MKRIAVCLAALFLLISATIFYLKSPAGKTRVVRYLENYSAESFNLPLEVTTIDYSFFPLTLFLSDMDFFEKEQQKPFLHAPKVKIELPYSVFWSDTIRISRLEFENPELHLNRISQQKLSSEVTRKLWIDEGQIINGRLKFANGEARNLKMNFSVHENQLAVRKMSTLLGDTHLTSLGKVDDLSALRYSFQYQLSGNISSALKFTTDFVGNVVASGTLHGEKSRYALRGKIAGTSFSIFDSPTFAANAVYEVVPDAGENGRQKVRIHGVVNDRSKFTLSGTLGPSQFDGELIGNTPAIGDVKTNLSVRQGQLFVKATLPRISAHIDGSYDLKKEMYRMEANMTNTSRCECWPCHFDEAWRSFRDALRCLSESQGRPLNFSSPFYFLK